MTDDAERLRCWALGVRVREATDDLIHNARELNHPMSPRERENRTALFRTQLSNLEDELGKSRDCGGEALSMVYMDSDRLRKAFAKDSRAVGPVADNLGLTLHTVASERATGEETGGPQMRAAIATAMPGRFPFIDAEAFWEGLGSSERRAFLASHFDYGIEEATELSRRPFGALDKDFQDVLKGMAASGKLRP